jgi:hypothetical protein
MDDGLDHRVEYCAGWPDFLHAPIGDCRIDAPENAVDVIFFRNSEEDSSVPANRAY